jgi:hypothetical protein
MQLKRCRLLAINLLALLTLGLPACVTPRQDIYYVVVTPVPLVSATPTGVVIPDNLVPAFVATASVPIHAPSQNGYLWWLNDRRIDIFVTAPMHQEVTDTLDMAAQWVQQNEACYADSGASYILDSSSAAPRGAVGIQVTSGKCQGFRGWVFAAALHAEQP